MPSPEIDWPEIRKVLVIRLRSIGDTVLSTPSLIALRRFLPDAEIDILLEDWVAPLLTGFESVDRVISLAKGNRSKLRTARNLRKQDYDVVFNLHGGTTATFLAFAANARYRIGYSNYQYSFLHTNLLSSAAEFWHTSRIHSAEQQLGLLGFAGVPVTDRPRSMLKLDNVALASITRRLRDSGVVDGQEFALLHPAAAFATKQWSAENFARIAEELSQRGITCVAVAANDERGVLGALTSECSVPITAFHDLSLPEIVAMASMARIFVGNDSGIAHIAAAVNTPTVVIFGSSNIDHWRPWTDAPNEVVFEKLACQPCPGYKCAVFGEPKCILSVTVASVTEAVEKVLNGE